MGTPTQRDNDPFITRQTPPDSQLSHGILHPAAEERQQRENNFALVLYLFLLRWGMHPPLFRKTHRLSDWPECVIELHCLDCRGGSVGYPVRLLMERRGDMTFENLLRRLRC